MSEPHSSERIWTSLLVGTGWMAEVADRKGRRGTPPESMWEEAGGACLWTVGCCSPLLPSQKRPPSPTFPPNTHTPNLRILLTQGHHLLTQAQGNKHTGPWSSSHPTHPAP